MDWVTARNDAILAVLVMLQAEHRLSDEHSSVVDVTDAEREVDGAARKLAEAVEDLERDRKPAGWARPAEVSGVARVARLRFARAALRVIVSEYAEEGADKANEGEYADDQMALAARNLTADIDAQRASGRAGGAS